MTWHWYVSRPDEIFVDLDSKRAMTRAFSVLRRAMNRKDKPLEVDSIWLYPSMTPEHAHLVVVTKTDLEPLERLTWALWLGSDRIRAVYAIERLRRMCINADILSTRSIFAFRPPDDTCECEEKHKAKTVTDSCPAMMRLLGEERSGDYFPRNRDRIKRPRLAIPWGRVPNSHIRNWGM